MQAGDRVHVRTPGGGGYGDPTARNPGAVQRDTALGYYRPEEAEDRFGVVLRDGQVDTDATLKKRRKIKHP